MYNVLRPFTTCSTCVSGSEARAGKKSFKCNETNSIVSCKSAENCKYYKSRIGFYPLGQIPVGDDGIPVRNTTSLLLLTKSQWAELGRSIKADAKGHEMHPSMMARRTYVYYTEEETEGK